MNWWGCGLKGPIRNFHHSLIYIVIKVVVRNSSGVISAAAEHHVALPLYLLVGSSGVMSELQAAAGSFSGEWLGLALDRTSLCLLN